MTDVPVIGFRRLLATMDWQQGEHVTALGPTGQGKTTVVSELLDLRDYVVVLASKFADDAYDQLLADGYTRIEEWPPPEGVSRVLLWPRFRTRDEAIGDGKRIFQDALDSIIEEQAWTVDADELLWMKRLGLLPILEDIWQLGRSMALSLVGCSQRPFSVPQPALSQATHLFLWGTADDRDLKRLTEISGGIDKSELRETLRKLPDYAFVYVNVRDRTLAVSRFAPPTQLEATA